MESVPREPNPTSAVVSPEASVKALKLYFFGDSRPSIWHPSHLVTDVKDGSRCLVPRSSIRGKPSKDFPFKALNLCVFSGTHT